MWSQQWIAGFVARVAHAEHDVGGAAADVGPGSSVP
jgi:hypothetical protein